MVKKVGQKGSSYHLFFLLGIILFFVLGSIWLWQKGVLLWKNSSENPPPTTNVDVNTILPSQVDLNTDTWKTFTGEIGNSDQRLTKIRFKYPSDFVITHNDSSLIILSNRTVPDTLQYSIHLFAGGSDANELGETTVEYKNNYQIYKNTTDTHVSYRIVGANQEEVGVSTEYGDLLDIGEHNKETDAMLIITDRVVQSFRYLD